MLAFGMSGAGNNSRFENLQEAEAAKAIAALRKKLLDLSNRNRLLNFSHSPRGRTHVRVIDEIPAYLYTELQKGADFGFKSIPEPDDYDATPRDEQTDAFEAAHDLAQAEDKEYLALLEKLTKQFDSDDGDEGYLRILFTRGPKSDFQNLLQSPAFRNAVPHACRVVRILARQPACGCWALLSLAAHS